MRECSRGAIKGSVFHSLPRSHSLSLSLCLSLPLHLSISISIIYLCLCSLSIPLLFIYLSFYLYIYLYISFFLYISFSVSVTRLFIYLSIYLSIPPCYPSPAYFLTSVLSFLFAWAVNQMKSYTTNQPATQPLNPSLINRDIITNDFYFDKRAQNNCETLQFWQRTLTLPNWRVS